MSETKRYYWIKLRDNFFEDNAIKKLRKIAGGDIYTIIYLKMLLLSMRDGGKLYYQGIEDTFESEIALSINENEENVRITTMYLKKMGLLEDINDDVAYLTRMPEMVGSETNKAEYMRIYRHKKELEGNIVTQTLPACNLNVEPRNKENRNKDINIKDIDINLSINQIKKQVEYDNIRTDMTMTERDILEDVIAVMRDVYTGTSDTIMIGRDIYTRHQVIDRLNAIDASCMRYIVASISKKSKSISNPRAYILTCLYNAPITIDTQYITDLNNDT